jgi:predicted ATPase/DNA-binding CsgD family transcriptional regulator
VVAYKLPSYAIPFIGRAEELTQIASLLRDPNCCLLTLVGPGGIGKTRLALEAARLQLDAFDNGVHFVPLQPLTSPDFIIPAIAEAIHFQFYPSTEPKQQLLDYLREKSLLLVLDNFEHLVDGVDLLPEILEAAANVRLLVTSRERLHLREEWVFEVHGLSFPENGHSTALEDYSAAQLFVQSTRRMGYTPVDADIDSIVRICQIVEGMPLALELAAAWVRSMPCAEIAREIEGSLDILTTTTRNVPEKHRSMRAAFEYSWKLLTEQEQSVLRKLSVFRGGFTREGAEMVAGTSLLTLASLVDKSLLRMDTTGRYSLHELLRQYGENKLLEAGEATVVAHRHLEYFLSLAEQAEAHVYGREQVAWFDRLEVEHDNLRAALGWSARGGQAETGLRLAAALGWFWIWRSLRNEGFVWLEQLLAAAPDAPATLRAKALNHAGELLAGRDRRQIAPPLWEEALFLARDANDPRNIAWALAALGFYFYRESTRDLSQAGVLLEESLALFRELEDPFGQSHLLRRRAIVAMEQGDNSYARLLLEEALTRAHDMDDRNTTAWALYLLGCVVWSQDRDFRQTRILLGESLSLFREIRGTAESIYPLILLAGIEQAAGHYAQSQMLYEEALVMMRDMGAFKSMHIDRILGGLGSLAMARGKLEQAARLLGAAEIGLKENLGRSLFPILVTFDSDVASLRAQLGEDGFASAWAAGQTMTTDQAVAYALQTTVPAMPHPTTSQPLADPLTGRELEVLRLVAQGLSNRAIAHELVVSLGTVKTHIHNICGKLDATSRTQAIARARDLNLL